MNSFSFCSRFEDVRTPEIGSCGYVAVDHADAFLIRAFKTGRAVALPGPVVQRAVKSGDRHKRATSPRERSVQVRNPTSLMFYSKREGLRRASLLSAVNADGNRLPQETFQELPCFHDKEYGIQ